MRRNISISFTFATALALGGLAIADDMTGTTGAPPATQPSTPPQQAVDLRNTVCPVSGDKVGDSKIVEIYNGKVYHLCCDSCPTDFAKNPDKYANAVAADPAKYGVK